MSYGAGSKEQFGSSLKLKLQHLPNATKRRGGRSALEVKLLELTVEGGLAEHLAGDYLLRPQAATWATRERTKPSMVRSLAGSLYAPFSPVTFSDIRKAEAT